MHETYTTVVGNVATRVDLRSLPDGTPVASFRVASNERRRDRATGTWRDGDTLYMNVTCWRVLGENVHASLGVGDPIVVYGRLSTRSWEKDGRRQSTTEMEGYAVGPDLARATAAVTRSSRSEPTGAGVVAGGMSPAESHPVEAADDEGGAAWASGMPDSGSAAAPAGGVPPTRPTPAEAGVSA